jgi:formate dehydrogenase iron-sulfur subunit
MADKSFLIDTSKCTACRGCQIACKQWNRLPAEKTINRGSHQNPPDLSAATYKLVRFSEEEVNGDPVWYFFPEQCRHCMEPPCQEAADSAVKGAIVKDEETGAVLYTAKTSELNFEAIRLSCPYNIPRLDPRTRRIFKCTMCLDRLKEGLLPACVKTCPSGAMSFGDREVILEKAQKRLIEVKKNHPRAGLLDPDDVRVIYLILEDRKKYHQYAAAEKGGLTRQAALKKIGQPFSSVVAGAAVVAFSSLKHPQQ